jgi:hypothetical protein
VKSPDADHNIGRRYDYGPKRTKLLNDAELAELGIAVNRKSLEEVYNEHMEKEPPADDYEIVRGPRPWEDHPQKEQMAKNKKVPQPLKTAGSYGL